VPPSGAYELRATAHDGSGYASIWIGSGERHPARPVPRPNLYHAMGDLRYDRIFALTPAGSMGMSDPDVDAGRFDKPGMLSMEHMDMRDGMGEGHHGGHTESMEHVMDEHPGTRQDEHSVHAMDMVEKPEDRTAAGHAGTGMTRHDMTPAESMPMVPEPDTPARSGRVLGTNFRPLASDVSSSSPLAVDGMDSRRPGPPYERLRSIKRTAPPEGLPLREIRLTLDGDMERYVWFINNRPLSETDSILIRKGEVVRFIMINRTMMHHPMHLHGHFFRVLNGQGDHAPLKHTVDVEPMSTTIIEFEADEFGDWFFHCHLLYHMKSGMARVIHYEGYESSPDVSAIRRNLYRESWYAWGEADVLTNMTEGYAEISDTRNIIAAGWEAGWQGVEDTQWEGTVSWERVIDRFFKVFAGGDFWGAGDTLDETRGVLGFRYLLPFNMETTVQVDSEGEGRFGVERDFQLMPRLDLFGEVQYDTDELWAGKAGLSYTLTKSVSLVAQWHSDYYWGGGVRFRF